MIFSFADIYFLTGHVTLANPPITISQNSLLGYFKTEKPH